MVELDSPYMSWSKKKIISFQWQYFNIKRHVIMADSVIGGIKRWWRLRKICKNINKALLMEAEKTKLKGLRPPPTMEELAEFKESMGGEKMLNTHCITRVTRQTKNLDMEIKYGN
jgi:hypothetical protein